MSERLDQALVTRKLCTSRQKAQALIHAGRVVANSQVLKKASQKIENDIILEVLDGVDFVSRAGHKLEFALEAFGVDPTNKIVLDVGASTGGFTDCLLRHGAKTVVAIDVGFDQMDPVLRQDKRVICLEGINARYLSPQQLPTLGDMAVVDVSFISQRLVLPALRACLQPGATILALFKPQFEVGAASLAKGGIVKDEKIRKKALSIWMEESKNFGLDCLETIESPLRGLHGNIEYFLHFTQRGESS